ncbi:MAG: DnaD domain protein, partial [Oscillospiraceae bacterium]
MAFKALLLYLRNAEQRFDEKELAARLGTSPDNVADALAYWVESGVLSPDEQSAPPPAPSPAPPPAAPSPVAAEPMAAPAAPAAPPAPVPPTRPRYPRDEAVAIIEKDKVLSSLVLEAQSALGKMLSSADMDALVGLYSYYGLSAHYIVTLLHYCVAIGKRSMGYAESVAASWMRDGIDDTTVDAQVDRLVRRRQNEGRIRSAFEIDRALVPKERECIDRWFGEWHCSLELVTSAYEISVERTGKLTFRYIDKVLESWHRQGITTPEQAKNEPKPNAAASGSSTLSGKILENLMKEIFFHQICKWSICKIYIKW